MWPCLNEIADFLKEFLELMTDIRYLLLNGSVWVSHQILSCRLLNVWSFRIKHPYTYPCSIPGESYSWWNYAAGFLYARRRLAYYVVPSVCLSVNFSCPLCNSDTFLRYFHETCYKYKHHQTMCREQEPTLHLYFYGIMAL